MSLRYVVLTLVNQSPCSGYDILKSFEGSVGHFWQASHQQIYRELAKLDSDGWLQHTVESQADKPDRKVYAITEDGRAALIAWLETPLPAVQPREALLVKLLSAESVGAAAMVAEVSHRSERVRARLKVYQGIEAEHYNPPPNARWPVYQQMLYLALRRGIIGCEAELAWLAEARAGLARLG